MYRKFAVTSGRIW